MDDYRELNPKEINNFIDTLQYLNQPKNPENIRDIIASMLDHFISRKTTEPKVIMEMSEATAKKFYTAAKIIREQNNQIKELKKQVETLTKETGKTIRTRIKERMKKTFNFATCRHSKLT